MAAAPYPLGHKIKNTPESTLQKALGFGVVLSAVGGKLRATGDRASVAELAPLIRQHRDELVRLLTVPTPTQPPTPAQPSPEAAPAPPKAVSQWCDVGQPLRTSEATDQVPPTPKKALAIDPGKRALLALVATYCDRTAVSDKARAQWAQDVEDTPPELRGDLYQHLREQLPPAPPAPPKPHPAPAPKPMGWLHMEQPWRAADRLYQNHHWQCTVCKAAARAAPGTADRCAEGRRLHDECAAQAATA